MTVAATLAPDPDAFIRKAVKFTKGGISTSRANLARVVRMYARNKYSVGMIRQTLTHHKIQPPTGRQWTDSQVPKQQDEHGLSTNAGELAEQLGRLPNPRPKLQHPELN